MHKDLSNPHYVEWLKFLRSSEEWSAEQIRSYSTKELLRILDWAASHTAGYRALFEEWGVSAIDLTDTDDIRRFPFLHKEDIRARLEEFSADVSERFIVATGGSTGIPVSMYRDPVSFAKELASKAHQYHRVGWKEGDRQIVFRGLKIDSPDGIEFVEEFNELRCSTYEFGTGRMAGFVDRAWEYKPEWVRCYPSSGYIFARFLIESGLEFPPIKGILCSSEQLFDFQAKAMRRAFGDQVKVFSHYGHYEMAALAGYCEATTDYHVLPQYGFVELLDENDCPVATAGEVGEIVATSFIMQATPFIRYRTRDYAVFKSFGCEACGRPYQVWERVEGRAQDLIVSSTGRIISMTMLNMHDGSYDHVRQFQIHQSFPGKVTFRFIRGSGFDAESEKRLSANLRTKLGNDIELRLERVDEIPLTKRGKQAYLVQELDLRSTLRSLRASLSV